MINIKPMYGFVLIREIQSPVITKGGLILPESAKKQGLMRGEVVKLGDAGPDYDCSDIKIGTKVMFVEYSSADVEEDGLRLLPYTEIKAVYED